MRHIMRDSMRSLLILLLSSVAAMIAGLGATVHVFTLQQIQAVEDNTVTLAVRHYAQGSYFYDSRMLAELSEHSSVKVPAQTKSYSAIDTSIIPVYSGDVEGSYYHCTRDDEIARTVMTVTCTKDLGKDQYSDNWYALVKVEEIHLALPYKVPDTIRVIGVSRGTANKQNPLVPGQTYLLCGTYEDYPWKLDWEASIAGGQYDPVYVPSSSELPQLRLSGWQDNKKWMKYIASPDDEEWLNEAIRIGDINNRSLRLNCINDINRIRWFVDGKASIVEGRSFTKEEQNSGAKVCLVSQALAQVNGLTIGDHIAITAHPTITNVMLYFEEDMLDETYPFVDIYESAGEHLSLEIVGIYSAPLYKNTIDGFTPNTIIAPYLAVQLDPGRGFSMPVHTQNFILRNGQGEEFLNAVREAGYPDGLYTIYETNYDAVKEVLSYMNTDSMMLLVICTSVGVLMLVIVLALYARSWRKENAILAMLGTTKIRIALRMFVCLMVLILLGCTAAFGGICAAKSYMEATLNRVYIGENEDFSAIRVGAFSAEGMTISMEVIVVALGLTTGAFLLIAAIQSAISARKKVHECLFD